MLYLYKTPLREWAGYLLFLSLVRPHLILMHKGFEADRFSLACCQLRVAFKCLCDVSVILEYIMFDFVVCNICLQA